jgi:dihydrofolate synthase/folylpolyglutamate synthase
VNGRQVLIDGGHTPLSARRLAEAIAPALPGGVRVIAGMLADKNAAAYLAELDAPGVTLVCTTAPTERARPAADLAAACAPVHARVSVLPDFEDALNEGLREREGLVVIAGSLRMAAAAREALGLLDADALEEAHRTRALFEGPDYRGRWQR